MCDEPRHARRRPPQSLALLLAAALGLGQVLVLAARAQAAPEKARSTRKVYDLTPPRPGEMLANPARGSGSPPQLKEFAPSAAMHLSQDEASAATSGAGSQHSSQENIGFGQSMSAQRTLAAGPPVQASNLHRQLTDEITRFGIEGFLSRPPQAGSPQELQYWEAVRREVAASLATWQSLYAPDSAPKNAGAQAPPAPPRSAGPTPTLPTPAAGPKP